MSACLASNVFLIVDCVDHDQMAAAALRRMWERYKVEQAEKGIKVKQEEFARKFGWKQSTLSGYLNGASPIGLQALIALSAELNCDPCDIRVELTPRNKIELNDQELAKLNGKVVEIKTQWKQEIQNLRDQMEALVSTGKLHNEVADSLLNCLTDNI